MKKYLFSRYCYLKAFGEFEDETFFTLFVHLKKYQSNLNKMSEMKYNIQIFD